MIWSKNYAECKQCGTIEKPHMAQGLCNSCYLFNYRNNPKHKGRIAKQKRSWYLKKDRKPDLKIRREQIHFDGKREAVLQRDLHKCTECKSTKQLVIHHVDFNGRGSKVPNNDIENLTTLCRACHAKVHGKIKTWARNWTKCRLCNSTERRHNAKGYCTTCYHKAISKDMVCSSEKSEED